MEDDLDVIAVTAERLVDGVVDGLVDEVVQTVGARVADVHGRALADGLEALQYLDVACCVAVVAHAAPLTADEVLQQPSFADLPPRRRALLAEVALGGGQENLPRSSDMAKHSLTGTRVELRQRVVEEQDGSLPTAAATGPRSASRSARAINRC